MNVLKQPNRWLEGVSQYSVPYKDFSILLLPTTK